MESTKTSNVLYQRSPIWAISPLDGGGPKIANELVFAMQSEAWELLILTDEYLQDFPLSFDTWLWFDLPQIVSAQGTNTSKVFFYSSFGWELNLQDPSPKVGKTGALFKTRHNRVLHTTLHESARQNCAGAVVLRVPKNISQ